MEPAPTVDVTLEVWWPWLTSVAIPAVGALGTIAVAVVAVTLAQANTKTERLLRARERRIEFSAHLRAFVNPQILQRVLGKWTLADFGDATHLYVLGDRSDSPQAGGLVAWSMMFLTSTKPESPANQEAFIETLMQTNGRFDEVVSRWVDDPRIPLDFSEVQGHVMSAAEDAIGTPASKKTST